MREDYLKDKKAVYIGSAQLKGTPSEAMICLTVLIIVCVLAFNLASHLPYSGLFKAAILVFTALAINYILKKGTFSVTYVLTEDKTLVYLTKYGRLQWETAWIDLNKAEIHEGYILYEKRKYEFFPDDELKAFI